MITEFRRAESGNKHNRRISQIAEDYEKLKARVDEEIRVLKNNSEMEGTLMDPGIDVQEMEEINE